MKKLFLSIVLLLGLSSSLLAPLQLASASTVPKPDYLPGPSEELTGDSTQDYVLNVTVPRTINIAIGLMGLGAFIGILISAITMLTAYGNEDKINRAKNNLKYSLLGFMITVLSYAIVSIVVSVSLPQEDISFIPTAHAVSSRDVNVLLPSQRDLIENQDPQGRVSLPSGDLVTEVVPGIITNILYMVGLLIFIALMYGGVLLVIGRGNEDMTNKAKSIITYGGVALVLVTLGYAIIYGIATLNFNQDDSTDADDVFVESIQQ